MNIYTIQTTPIETNTYLVTNGKLGFLVDPGGDEDKIDKIIHEAGDVSIETGCGCPPSGFHKRGGTASAGRIAFSCA